MFLSFFISIHFFFFFHSFFSVFLSDSLSLLFLKACSRMFGVLILNPVLLSSFYSFVKTSIITQSQLKKAFDKNNDI